MKRRKTTDSRKLSIYGFRLVENGHNFFALLDFDVTELREILNITAVFNHDIMDGAPAAWFINRLKRYIESDYRSLA